MTLARLLEEFRQLTLVQQIDLLQMVLKIVSANMQMAIDVEHNQQPQRWIETHFHCANQR